MNTKTFSEFQVLDQGHFLDIVASYPMEASKLDINVDSTATEKGKLKSRPSAKLAQLASEDEDSGTVYKQQGIWLPHDLKRRVWEIFSFLTVIYSAITVPIRIAFLADSSIWTFSKVPSLWTWVVLDALSTVVMVVDMRLQLRFAYINDQGKVVQDRTLLREKYVKSGRRFRDILATIPFDAIVLILSLANVLSDGDTFKIWSLARLPSLLRVTRLPHHLDDMELLLQERGIKLNAAMGRIYRLIFFQLLVVHVSACCWYFIA